jgi:hypothetical protein
MRFFAVVLAALFLPLPARAADVRVTVLPPAADVSLPFFCDWGYDWDERCYRDDSERLALGGEPGKVWRSALQFSPTAIPAGASIVTAELSLWYDGTCVGARKTVRPCDGRGFGLESHRILTQPWFSEREVEIDPLGFLAAIEPFATPQWVVFDVTDLVAAWHDGTVPNSGLLVKLADEQEAYDRPGPSFPSSTYGDPSMRPRLTVSWSPG